MKQQPHLRLFGIPKLAGYLPGYGRLLFAMVFCGTLGSGKHHKTAVAVKKSVQLVNFVDSCTESRKIVHRVVYDNDSGVLRNILF